MGKTKNGIYYQDNYASKADILKDQKEMAESIDLIIDNIDSEQEEQDKKIKSIEQKNTEQDTNIGNIQKENIELKEENIRIKNDLKSSVLIGQVKSENIVLNDSSNARLMKLEIGGNHKQETRTGKNLYNAGKSIDDYFVTAGAKGNTITQYEAKDYVTCKIDKGVMTVEKYNTSGYNWIAKWIEIDKNADYTISLDKSATSVSVVGFSTKENKTEGVIIAELIGSKKEVSFNSGDYAYYAVSFYPNQGLEIAIQIEKGKQKTTFEQYGAMPSFEFQSEVRAVGDNVNLLNIADIEETTSRGITYSIKNGIINLNGTASAGIRINLAQNVVLKKGNYTHSTKYIPNDIFVSFDNKNETALNKTTFQKTFNLIEDTTFSDYFIWINQGSVLENIKLNLKLEKGSKATAYSPYNQGSTNIVISNKNWLKLINTSLSKSGIDISSNNENITINGTVKDGNINIYNLFDNMFLKKGTYTFRFNCQKPPAPNTCQFILCKTDGTRVITLNAWTTSQSKTITLEEDTIISANKSYLYANKDTTYSNTIYKLQIEQGTVATDIVPHEEQNYIMPVQEKMLAGDGFVKTNNIWYEKHIFDMFSTLNNSNVKINTTVNSDAFYRHHLVISNDIKRKKGSYIKIMSTHFKFADSRWGKNEGICGWEVGNSFCIGTYNKNYDTTEKMNDFLSKNDVKIYYELETPKLIECTEEQKKVLEQIEKEAHTYKNITHIYSTDEVSPILDVEYVKDLDTVLNNLANASLVGGN